MMMVMERWKQVVVAVVIALLLITGILLDSYLATLLSKML